MKKQMMIASMALSMAFTGVAFHAHAEETMGDKVKEGYEDAKKGVKRTWRNAKNEVCEWVNGKVECAAKKVANEAKNAADEVKDKADDIKKKID